MRPWFKVGFQISQALGFAGLIILVLSRTPVSARQSANATPTVTGVSSNSFITVTYIEPINVRAGPSSLDYPIVGSIPTGDTAPAIGRSPAGEWIQIVFPVAPRGTGWVYAPNVTLSPGALLPVIEPPPTAVPLETPTFNPTYIAAFQTAAAVATPTRLPTFTLPPPLAIPTYADSVAVSAGRLRTSWAILGLGLIGVVTLIFSSLRRR